MAPSTDEIDGPLPTYTERDEGLFSDDLITGTQHLNITKLKNNGDTPNVDETLVHLKLLHAIHNLRVSVSGTDGLYDLYDADVTDTFRGSETSRPDASKVAQLEAVLLTRLKEKRWAIFVTRAAKRFEAWWMRLKKRINGEFRLSQYDLHNLVSLKKRVSWSRRVIWQRSDLPPLDVLMVWHAFMLNPRCFLEDCLRLERMDLWESGMPWAAINASIDIKTEEYEPGGETHAEFETVSQIKWSSFDEPNEISIKCYRCLKSTEVPLFTISRPNIVSWAAAAMKHGSLQNFPRGSGWADAGFLAKCSACKQSIINHKTVQAGHFADDVQLRKDRKSLMPGTILLDVQGTITELRDNDPRLFPNKLVERLEFGCPRSVEYDSIDDIRRKLNKILRTESDVNSLYRKKELPAARKYVRYMLSRYEDNSSPFALDLVGAVIRQGSFIEKMENIDWLHSPTAQITMTRLLEKYGRFFAMMRSRVRDTDITVPTLDVDLAWHTNQLSPSSYYKYSTRMCRGKFVDHDDKIPEAKLSIAFKYTSRFYEELYKEPYSECVCWYCEAIRASNYSRLSRIFNPTTPIAVDNALYKNTDRGPLPSDPHKGPHISAHSATRALTKQPKRAGTKAEADLVETQAQLLAAYKVACRRAKRRGRAPPALPLLLDDKRLGREGAENLGAASGVALGVGLGVGLVLTVPYLAMPCDGGIYVADPTTQDDINCAAGTCSGAACGATSSGTCDASACGGGDGGGCSGCGGCGGCGG